MGWQAASPLNWKRLYGPISLGVVVTGSAVTVVLSRIFGTSNVPLRLLTDGFHAGLVGALADWYAVHVLLHPAPWFMQFGLFKTHSDLLIRNRPKLEQNVVRMVQDDLLAPEKIWGHLERNAVFDRFVDLLQRPDTPGRLVAFLQAHELLVPLANQADRPDVAASLERVLKEALEKARIGRPLGAWLQQAIERGEQHTLWTWLHHGLVTNLTSPPSIDLIGKVIRSAAAVYLPVLRVQAARPEVQARLETWLRSWLEGLDLARLAGTAVRDAIYHGAHDPLMDDLLGHLHDWVREDAGVRAAVSTMVEEAIESYKREIGPVRRMFATFVEWVALDKTKAVGAIVDEIADYIRLVQQDRSHPLRVTFQEQVVLYATRLAEGDPAIREGFERLRKQLLAVKLQPVLEQLVTWIVDTCESELNSPASATGLVDVEAMARAVAAGAKTVLDEVMTNPQHPVRAGVDDAVRQYAARLAAGDPQATAVLERLQRDMIGSADVHSLLRSLLSVAKDKLLVQLADRGSPLWESVGAALQEARDRFVGDFAGRARLVEWLRPKTRAFLEQNHSHIGVMVETSLQAIADAALVEIVDDKFGDDLQYVRLNGAILGFLIGVVLSSLSRLAGW